ncbi:MAG: hypothetical protein EU539_09270 [Promethearchaeota archaeon]|nr:MAG: hypothetical protein EU539_09270 [Candidatus Lokiarchaeota archaeon]
MENLDWEQLKKEFENSINLEKDEDQLSIKIKLLKEPEFQDNPLFGNVSTMLKGEQELRHSLSQFMNEGKPINCEIEIDREEKQVVLTFKEKEEWNKTFNFLKELFFGDYFKKILEAMMGAFGGFFNKNDFSPF